MVVVVGSANMDLVARVARFPAPGETILGEGFATYPGGKGANQAVAIGKLGGSVTFVGKVGEDGFGDRLEASLRAAGVSTEGLARTPDQPTGTAIILVDDDAENQIVVIPGANAALTPDEAATRIGASGASVALFQLECPIETVRAGLAEAKRCGMKTILNPAPAAPLPPAMLRDVDVLTPNRTEAATLTGLSGEPDEMIAALLDMGVGAVAMTRGKEGCVYGTPGRTVAIPSIAVEAVDTTAAGDAFNGALALFLSEGMPAEHAIAGANRVGALAATKAGAQASMPTREELEALGRWCG